MSPRAATDKMSTLEGLLPENAKRSLESAVDWIRKNPAEAAVLSAAGGFLIGLTGVGRIYSGIRTLRSMPLVSRLVLGVVARGVVPRELRTPSGSGSGSVSQSMH